MDQCQVEHSPSSNFDASLARNCGRRSFPGHYGQLVCGPAPALVQRQKTRCRARGGDYVCNYLRKLIKTLGYIASVFKLCHGHGHSYQDLLRYSKIYGGLAPTPDTRPPLSPLYYMYVHTKAQNLFSKGLRLWRKAAGSFLEICTGSKFTLLNGCELKILA